MLRIKQALIIAFLAHGALFTTSANALSDMENKPVTFDSLVAKANGQ